MLKTLLLVTSRSLIINSLELYILLASIIFFAYNTYDYTKGFVAFGSSSVVSSPEVVQSMYIIFYPVMRCMLRF